MNTIQFQGHHSRIPHADITLLPDTEHTFWQAWRLPSGDYVIQALTEDKRPEGVTHRLDGKVFPHVLTPLLATIDPATKADSPNLIATWYNEVSSLKGTELYGPPIIEYDSFTMPPLHPETLAAIESAKALEENPDASAGPCPSSAYDTEKPRVRQLGRLSSQEPISASIPSQATDQQDKQNAVDSPKTLAMQDVTNLTEAVTSPSSQTTLSGTAYPPAMQEAIRALASNELAPPQIDDFFKQLLEEAEQPLEEHIARLTAFPAQENSTAYQAVLTELGLVLRQKKLFELAKQCHLRALELTPFDERILFNIARTEYESGNIKAAQEYLNRCLAIAPDFNVAKNFLTFISAGS